MPASPYVIHLYLSAHIWIISLKFNANSKPFIDIRKAKAKLTLQQFHPPVLEYPNICNLEKLLQRACHYKRGHCRLFLNKMNAEKDNRVPKSQENKEKIDAAV